MTLLVRSISVFCDAREPIVAVTVAFPLVEDETTSFLAWTTTPWTLPSNLGLCVHPDFTYVKVYDEERKRNFILHENLLKTVWKDPKKAKIKVVQKYKGAELKGKRYVPIFDYFVEKVRRAHKHASRLHA